MIDGASHIRIFDTDYLAAQQANFSDHCDLRCSWKLELIH